MIEERQVGDQAWLAQPVGSVSRLGWRSRRCVSRLSKRSSQCMVQPGSQRLIAVATTRHRILLGSWIYDHDLRGSHITPLICPDFASQHMSSTTASPRSLTTSARPFTCTSSFSTRSHLDWSSSSAAVSGAWSESPTSSPTPSPSSRVAGRITDLYLCIAQRGPAYRGYDPDDSEGETMDDFLGWCVRRARGHEAAVLGDKRSAHKRALLGLNARKEYRRAMCGKISELRQVCSSVCLGARCEEQASRGEVADGSDTLAVCTCRVPSPRGPLSREAPGRRSDAKRPGGNAGLCESG